MGVVHRNNGDQRQVVDIYSSRKQVLESIFHFSTTSCKEWSYSAVSEPYDAWIDIYFAFRDNILLSHLFEVGRTLTLLRGRIIMRVKGISLRKLGSKNAFSNSMISRHIRSYFRLITTYICHKLPKHNQVFTVCRQFSVKNDSADCNSIFLLDDDDLDDEPGSYNILRDLRRIHVDNLSYDVSYRQLKNFMKSIGPVYRAHILTDEYGRSIGRGVVEFFYEEDCSTAIKKLDGVYFCGRNIRISEGIQKQKNRSSNDIIDGFESSQPPPLKCRPGCRIIVKNFSYTVTKYTLIEKFSLVGKILDALVMSDRRGKSKGFGFVEYLEVDHAQEAIEKFHRSIWLDKKIVVEADERERLEVMNSLQ